MTVSFTAILDLLEIHTFLTVGPIFMKFSPKLNTRLVLPFQANLNFGERFFKINVGERSRAS